MGIGLKIRFTQTAISWFLFFLGFRQSVKRQLRLHVESLIEQGTALHNFKWLLWFRCTQANAATCLFCHLVGGTAVDFHVKRRQMYTLFEWILLDSKLAILFNMWTQDKSKRPWNSQGTLFSTGSSVLVFPIFFHTLCSSKCFQQTCCHFFNAALTYQSVIK